MDSAAGASAASKTGEGSSGNLKSEDECAHEDVSSTRKRKEPPNSPPSNEDDKESDEDEDRELYECYLSLVLDDNPPIPSNDSSTRKKNTYQHSLKMLELLRAFKANKGNCNPPQSYPKLGHWVNAMRMLKKKKDEAGRYTSSRINDYIVGQLDELDFSWRVNFSWDERFEQLVLFKKSRKHCNVPTKERGLGRWVSEQRRFKKNEPGARGPLTDERIEKLEELGFSWELKMRKK